MRAFALAAVLALAAGRADAAGQGARLIAIVPEGGGQARAQLEVDDAALQKDFAAGLGIDRLRAAVGAGGALPQRVSRVVGTHEKIETVLAFDQSGSFARFWSEAFGLAHDAFAPALDRQATRQARVVTFGLRTDSSPVVQGGDALTKLLAATQAQKPNQKATRLKAAILDAARLVSTDVPLSSGGVREVVVFTDAGEESDAYDVDGLIKHLAVIGVRVHVVCFYRGSPGQGRMASRLDQMKRLAEGTGGTYLQVDDHVATQSALAQVAASVENLYWVSLAFCGVPGARPVFEERLSLEVLTQGVRAAWTDGLAFEQHAEGGALRNCPTNAPVPTPLPSTTAQPPVQPPTPSPSPVQAAPTPPIAPPTIDLPVEESRFPFWWLLLALLALMALVFFLRRRKEEPAVVVAPVPVALPAAAVAIAPVPVPVEVAAPPAAVAPAAVWNDPLATLPETRLLVVRGPAGVEPSYRIHKREFTIGGSSGPDVDVVVALPQLSSRHATFQLYPTGAVFVMDLRSTNGTYVDQRRLGPGERVQLQPGQTIQLSQQLELKLEQPGQVSASPIGAGSAPAGATPAPESARVKAKTVYSPVSGRDKE